MRKPVKETLSGYLRAARVSREISVAAVAEKLGVTTPCVYYWETGKTKPRAGNLSALCKMLKVPLKEAQELANA